MALKDGISLSSDYGVKPPSDLPQFPLELMSWCLDIQGAAQKVLDNCSKTFITSYMDIIYFYSSKYIPP
jgi:hypothetical protein